MIKSEERLVEQVTHKPASKAVIVVKESKATWLIVGLLAITLAVSLLSAVVYNIKDSNKTALVGVEKGNYQAVFLTNGQVYFGKLSSADDNTIKITDIYYLQVEQAVQPKPEQTEADQQQNIKLAKLGGELHGPKDDMYIDRSQVLFWENLKGKKDSKVVEAIEAYKDSKKR